MSSVSPSWHEVNFLLYMLVTEFDRPIRGTQLVEGEPGAPWRQGPALAEAFAILAFLLPKNSHEARNGSRVSGP